jgi:hypothetical protein
LDTRAQPHLNNTEELPTRERLLSEEVGVSVEQAKIDTCYREK